MVRKKAHAVSDIAVSSFNADSAALDPNKDKPRFRAANLFERTFVS